MNTAQFLGQFPLYSHDTALKRVCCSVGFTENRVCIVAAATFERRLILAAEFHKLIASIPAWIRSEFKRNLANSSFYFNNGSKVFFVNDLTKLAGMSPTEMLLRILISGKKMTFLTRYHA